MVAVECKWKNAYMWMQVVAVECKWENAYMWMQVVAVSNVDVRVEGRGPVHM